jgi:hypothetical protein
MYQSLKNTLSEWNTSTSERSKLQHLYITVAVILIIAAGVVGLLNQDLGQQILGIAIMAAGIFLINAVAWALLQSFVLLKIDRTPAPTVKPVVTPTRTTRKK